NRSSPTRSSTNVITAFKATECLLNSAKNTSQLKSSPPRFAIKFLSVIVGRRPINFPRVELEVEPLTIDRLHVDTRCAIQGSIHSELRFLLAGSCLKIFRDDAASKSTGPESRGARLAGTNSSSDGTERGLSRRDEEKRAKEDGSLVSRLSSLVPREQQTADPRDEPNVASPPRERIYPISLEWDIGPYDVAADMPVPVSTHRTLPAHLHSINWGLRGDLSGYPGPYRVGGS
ncbi:unnamed protein product, partial [Heterotrigona itama]